MKLMVLMLLMMNNLTIMTMMMILMMIRLGEGGTVCWLASQLASQLASRGTLTLSEKIFDSENPGSSGNHNFAPLIIFWGLGGS